jgi:hypothetical protein
MKNYEHSQNRLLCRLSSGEIVPYDNAMSCDWLKKNKDKTPDKKVFKFIGIGVIYSVDDVLQNDTVKCKFYVKR